jgi:hypothetical protein
VNAPPAIRISNARTLRFFNANLLGIYMTGVAAYQ